MLAYVLYYIYVLPNAHRHRNCSSSSSSSFIMKFQNVDLEWHAVVQVTPSNDLLLARLTRVGGVYGNCIECRALTKNAPTMVMAVQQPFVA